MLLRTPLALIIFGLAISVGGCASTNLNSSPAGNPPAPGFNADASDARAIAVADRTMRAMGGRQAWDDVRFITWNFFGRRQHIWDKKTGDVRIEYTNARGEVITTVMNLNTMQGDVSKETRDEAQLRGVLEDGYAAWVNDSYWLFMPYKMKDTGVTLKYLGEGETATGNAAEIVELTFDQVGVTPQNKYHVWVGKDSGLVEQWSFYMTAEDEEPRFVVPWTDWKQCGPIMLSGGRGERTISKIAVLSDVPAGVFESTHPIDWDAVMANAQ